MYLTYIFSDFLSSTLPPVIWLTHRTASTRPVAHSYLSTALEVGSPSVPVASCASVRYMCYMPTVQCFQRRGKSIHNNLRTHGKFSSSGLHSEQEGNKQKTRATRWTKTRRIYVTPETHPRESLVRLAQQTNVSASSARTVKTLLHLLLTATSHKCGSQRYKKRSCSNSIFCSKTVQQLTAFLTAFMMFCALKFYCD